MVDVAGNVVSHRCVLRVDKFMTFGTYGGCSRLGGNM